MSARTRRATPSPRKIALTGLIASLVIVASACGGSYDETIAGVAVPVPKGMTRTSEKPVEISVLGFGAGQASFQGTTETDKIVDFYKKELPSRGWQSTMNLRSGGAMLAYSKEGKTLLIGVGKQDGKTTLSLTVSGTAR
ncbi:MAG: hypothetical protein ACM3SP_15805 [Chloroflexota bacterium]